MDLTAIVVVVISLILVLASIYAKNTFLFLMFLAFGLLELIFLSANIYLQWFGYAGLALAFFVMIVLTFKQLWDSYNLFIGKEVEDNE